VTSVTAPTNLLHELFTVKGAGTLIKHGSLIEFHRDYQSVDRERLEVLLNSDPHAPAQYRAIGSASNMPAFAEAFGCKAGDAMVRGDTQRVRIW
jgi:hypothetical protein